MTHFAAPLLSVGGSTSEYCMSSFSLGLREKWAERLTPVTHRSLFTKCLQTKSTLVDDLKIGV